MIYTLLLTILVACSGAGLEAETPYLQDYNPPHLVGDPYPYYEDLGEFTLTAYCGCADCCGIWAQYHRTYTGTVPTSNRTVAVDPSVIPLGSTILIDGVEYVAEDTGSAVNSKHIDIYFDSHREAVQFGRRESTVSVLITE